MFINIHLYFTNVNFLWLFISILSFIFYPRTALSEGFRVFDQSTSATGQGAAFSAQADDPSALHYNPAGMTQLKGIQFSANTLLIGGTTKFKSAFGPRTNGNLGGTIANPPPTTFYLTAHLPALGLSNFPKWTLGIGVTTPFALQVEYPNDSIITPVATKASLPLIDIKPTLAYKLNDYIAIGGGLDIYMFPSFIGEGHATLQRDAESGNPIIPAGTPLEANVKDTALGFNVSVLLTPLRNTMKKPILNLGFVYRNGVSLNLDGQLLAGGRKLADASTTLELPNVYTWAIAGWPIRNNRYDWKVELDVEYADWSNLKDLNLKLSNGIVIPQFRNYGNSWVFMVGTEFKTLSPPILPKWNISFRAGYVHSQSSVPNNEFHPTNPDADFNAYSVGMGFMCHGQGKFLGLLPCNSLGAKGIGLDFAYQISQYQSRVIHHNQEPLVNGKWDTTLHVGSMSIRANF